MKKVFFIIMMAMSISAYAQVDAQTGASKQETKAAAPEKVYDETINTMEQIDKAVAQAKAEGKNVICQVGGNWCPWCLKFAKFIKEDTQIKAFIDENYVYIHVNYPSRKGNREAAKETMKRLGNPERFGFPVFVVLDSDGKVIHTQDSSFLEQGEGYDKEKTMRFLKAWNPASLNKK